MCIFCEIIKGNIPSYKIYEDDVCIAFLDISQATIGHTLIVPKEHIPNIFSLNEKTAAHLFAVANKIAKKISQELNIKDMNILNNNGKLAGQTVEHFHIHLLPRYENDKLKIEFSDNELTKDQFNELLNKLKF